ncbi:hypothetical protein HMPREF3033_01026 [Veillonellaceae bacterium DNF00751]|uniref:Uncharacterized protein n=1 Tax=Megasphaera lornae TaxID=1000568 RepID=D3LTE8_9FIRM|nr:hypothetical protein HMPREF0889_0548 [Megasphaera genomosp. type_1 str. 28L]KXB91482.1 hypothetical protein HMPREF3033_01026 [Veillonellaceae bacterium DNF00751]
MSSRLPDRYSSTCIPITYRVCVFHIHNILLFHPVILYNANHIYDSFSQEDYT